MKNLKKLVGFRNFLLGLISLTVFWACTKSDDYLKYVQGGEIIYTGKIDSVKVYSGRERVYVTGLFMADPKIVKLTAFWNNGMDSVTVPINRTANVDTLKLMIPVPEGIHNFYFVTYDEDNNTSLKVYKTGASFGERYQQGLINRAINAAGHFEGQTTAMAEFGGIDLTSGATFVEMEYTNLEGKKVRARESIDSVGMYFDNCLTTESVRYRTGYLPDSLSVDTFYTEFSQPRMLTVLPYLNNNKHPYSNSIWDGSRWGVPANWTVSSSVKNVSQGTYGGWERRGTGGALSLEGGWGLPGVTDGKIYQTIKPKLPAGKYRVSVGAIERGSGGVVYLVAALGATLPNMANVQTSSLAYLNMSSSEPNQYIEFTLTEAQQVSVGFAANMPDSGSYFKVIGSVIFEPVSE